MPKRPKATWDASRRRYEGVSDEDMRRFVREAADASKARVRELSEAYRRGDKNLAEWIIGMRAEVKHSYTTAAVIVNGGRERMDERKWGRVAQLIRFQNERLRMFERSEANNGYGTNAEFAARAEMYADSAVSGFESLTLGREVDAGVKRFRRVCPKDEASCTACVSAAGEYDSPDDVPRPGQQSCLSRCRCYIESLEEAA